ncbi:MAG: F0F1 ATP synthase subunit A [bacterium]
MHEVSIYAILGVPERYIPVAGSLFVFALAAIIALIIRISYKKIDTHMPPPKLTLTNALEVVIEMVHNFLESILGDNTKEFRLLLLSIFIYVLTANLSGAIPGFISPTGTASINAAMACFVLFYYNYAGFKKHGLHYFKNFTGPVMALAFLMIPIEIAGHLARPLSLTLRLTGNMSGEHLVMSIISGLAPYGVPVIFLLLSLITSAIQAVVFTALTAIYLSLSIETNH